MKFETQESKERKSRDFVTSSQSILNKDVISIATESFIAGLESKENEILNESRKDFTQWLKTLNKKDFQKYNTEELQMVWLASQTNALVNDLDESTDLIKENVMLKALVRELRQENDELKRKVKEVEFTVDSIGGWLIEKKVSPALLKEYKILTSGEVG